MYRNLAKRQHQFLHLKCSFNTH